MRRLRCICFAMGLASVGVSAVAMDDMKPQGMMMEMKAMDTNHDGMISKKEFMKFHEEMWAKMKKISRAWLTSRIWSRCTTA